VAAWRLQREPLGRVDWQRPSGVALFDLLPAWRRIGGRSRRLLGALSVCGSPKGKR